VLVIEELRREVITDPKTGAANEKPVLVFEDSRTKLVLNSTNWDAIAEIVGSDDPADWPGRQIELHADVTNIGATKVACVRIRAPGSAPKKTTAKKAAPATADNTDTDADLNDEIAF
jgi:hypothetical protein